MKLSTITQKYIGKPFEEMGCAQFIYSFYSDLGISLPSSIEGLDLENYVEEYLKNKKKVHGILTKLVKSLGTKSPIDFPKIGDLLLIYQPKGKYIFPAVYVGKSLAITSFLKTGVTVFRLDELNRAIVARRVL